MGVNHYICNTASSAFVTNGVTSAFVGSSTCTNSSLSSNSNTIGGIPQPSITSVNDCRTACLQYNQCQYGFDFNNVAPVGSQCYISTNSILNVGNIDGVDHYYCNSV